MNNLEGRRIALVGGAGFIGHHLALKLKECGADPYVVDGLSVNNFYSVQQSSSPDAVMHLHILKQRLNALEQAQVPVFVQDARDYDAMSALIKNIDCDSIVHLAAVSHAGRSNKDPLSTFDHSLRTLENTLDISRSKRLGIKHFIFLSSSMVYGNFKEPTVTENSPCEPLGIYGALKFSGEKMVIAYNQVFDLQYTIIRPSALYGPRCISRRVSQVFIEQALANTTITVNGDGTDRLDFTYVDDLVDGVVLTLTREQAINEVFNLTYGRSRSIHDLLDILVAAVPSISVTYAPRDRLLPQRGTLSVDKARELLGYSPKYNLEQGIPEYLHWYREHWDEWATLDARPEHVTIAHR